MFKKKYLIFPIILILLLFGCEKGNKCEHTFSSQVTLFPTCIDVGIKEYSCNKCGYSYDEEIAPLGHSEKIIKGYAASCNSDGLTDKIECERCGLVLEEAQIIPASEHSYRVTIERAFCETPGRIYYDCTKCNYSYSEEIAPLGHNEEIIKGYEATCNSTGLTDGVKCGRCGEILEAQEVIPHLNHQYKNEIIEATCTKSGHIDYECILCGDTYSEEIAPLGHNEEIIKGYEATCNSTGLTDGVKCGRCGEILEAQEVIPHLNHQYKNEIIEATCTKSGHIDYECILCGDTYSEEIAPLGHNEEIIKGYEATCYSTGLTDGVKCSRCDEILEIQQAINIVDHNYHNAICIYCNHLNSLMLASNYGYNYLLNLSNGLEMQKLYNDLEAAALAFNDNYELNLINENVAYINYSKYNLTKEEAGYVWSLFRKDNPQYFWLRYGLRYGKVTADDPSNNYNFLELLAFEDFYKGSIRKKYNDLLVEYIKLYIDEHINESNYAKALFYHDLIINQIDYKYDENNKPDSSGIAHSIAGVLDSSGVVCEGYAKMFEIMLRLSNVSVLYVTGGNHAFNLAQMDDGNWYWFDLTYDDTKELTSGIKHTYFCVNDSESLVDNNILVSFNFLNTHELDSYTDISYKGSYKLPSRSNIVFNASTYNISAVRKEDEK